MRIDGKCHCGNIEFSLDWPGASLAIPTRACDCSFCVKHGGVWTSNPQCALVAAIKEPALVSKYTFGTQTAIFHVCSRCGAVPFVTSEIDNHVYAVVNVNLFENVPRSRLQQAVANFDGEDVDARLARRKRNWISNVRITAGSA